MSVNLTTPVGRIVGGAIALQEKKDPVTGQVKLGQDGQPMMNCWFHIAIPKEAGHTHWGQTEWGQKVWAEGNRAHPTFAPHPSFAWKIEDGDSQAPNKKGSRNCDKEGHRGHWIVKFSNGFLPKTYNADGSQQIPPEAIKPGYYVQVNFDVQGNTGASPGVYLNPTMVALSAYGEEISFGPDVAAAGFGGAPLPAGAMATPPASFAPPPAAPAPAPFAQSLQSAQFPPPPLMGVAPAAPSMPMSNASGPPSNMAPPNPAILMMPPVPPAAPVHQMTAAAGGATYEQMIGAGWNDALLVQHGMMLA